MFSENDTCKIDMTALNVCDDFGAVELSKYLLCQIQRFFLSSLSHRGFHKSLSILLSFLFFHFLFFTLY